MDTQSKQEKIDEIKKALYAIQNSKVYRAPSVKTSTPNKKKIDLYTILKDKGVDIENLIKSIS